MSFWNRTSDCPPPQFKVLLVAKADGRTFTSIHKPHPASGEPVWQTALSRVPIDAYPFWAHIPPVDCAPKSEGAAVRRAAR